MNTLDIQLKEALEELNKPDVIERIVKELQLKREQQEDCSSKTNHGNQHTTGINYTRWRVHYVCNDCGAIGNRSLNQNEANKYYHLMHRLITI